MQISKWTLVQRDAGWDGRCEYSSRGFVAVPSYRFPTLDNGEGFA